MDGNYDWANGFKKMKMNQWSVSFADQHKNQDENDDDDVYYDYYLMPCLLNSFVIGTSTM